MSIASQLQRNLLGGEDYGSSGDGSGSDFLNEIKPSSFSDEVSHLKRYFDMSAWNYAIVAGIAVTGILAVINTYDAISGVNAKYRVCEQTTLKNSLTTKFIIILLLSILILIAGFVLAFVMRKQENQQRMVSLGLIFAGVAGIFYSISMQFKDTAMSLRLSVSWLLFFVFVLMGIFLKGKNPSIELKNE
jgi:hypothetical protein